MNEPISFRSVTDLEEVEALDDGAYIIVIENGTAKRISKANANFGGGSVTKYIVAGEKPTYTIANEDGSVVTPQEMYKAFMSGPVILWETRDGSGFAGTVLGIDFIGTPDNVTSCKVYIRNSNITISG